MADQSFNKWFGDSKVVDQGGNPLTVYHGTPAKRIESFRRDLAGKSNDPGFYGEGFYFTPSRALAEDYRPPAKGTARQPGSVVDAKLAIRNPFHWDLSNPDAEADTVRRVRSLFPEKAKDTQLVTTTGIKRGLSRDFTNRLKAAGHDGVFVHSLGELHEIVAFDPTQIKHASANSGSYDPNNPNIYKAGGGAIDNAIRIAREHGGRIKLHVGPIHSRVSGRTDHLPVHVPSGAYVLPSDIVSAMGEGNTLAGFEHVKRMFGGLPYHGKGNMPYGGGEGPYGSDLPKADGGSASNVGAPVPCVLAGGEYVLEPHEVMSAGDGDMDAGHKALDAFVNQYRAKTIKTLKGLPGPKKD